VGLIGQEATSIDEVQAGRYAQLDEIITEYHNPNDDHFHQQVMPKLGHLSGRELARLLGVDRRTIDRIRKGQTPASRTATDPHPTRQSDLAAADLDAQAAPEWEGARGSTGTEQILTALYGTKSVRFLR
jgi:hypothetical protein